MEFRENLTANIPSELEELYGQLKLTYLERIIGTDIFIGGNDTDTFSIQLANGKRGSPWNIGVLELSRKAFGIEGIPTDLRVLKAGDKNIVVGKILSDNQLLQEKIFSGIMTEADINAIVNYLLLMLDLPISLVLTTEGAKDAYRAFTKGFQQTFEHGLKIYAQMLLSIEYGSQSLVKKDLDRLVNDLVNFAKKFDSSEVGLSALQGRQIANVLTHQGLLSLDVTDMSPIYTRFYEFVSKVSYILVWLNSPEISKEVFTRFRSAIGILHPDLGMIFDNHILSILAQRIVQDMTDVMVKRTDSGILVPGDYNSIGIPTDHAQVISNVNDFMNHASAVRPKQII